MVANLFRFKFHHPSIHSGFDRSIFVDIFLGYNHWNMIFNAHHFPSRSFPFLYQLPYSKHLLVPSWRHFEFNPAVQMALCIFNCEWLDLGTGGRAFRCTWDKINLCGHKGGRLVRKGTSLYALARSCGPLSCTCVDPPEHADNPICLCLL